MDRVRAPHRRCAVVLLVLAGMLLPAAATANQGGITGVSGRQGVTCSSCHSGGSAPQVQLGGPAEMPPGAVATFRFTVTSAAPATQRFAGFNAAASAGTLDVIDGQGARRLGAELTHSARKANAAGGTAFWDFTWQAPAAPGDYTLFAAGNSVNGNGLQTGDAAAATTLVVRVLASTPTATLTPLPPSPTVPAASTETASATATRRETPTSTTTRTATASATPTPTLAPTGPSLGDVDCDGRVAVADLLALARAIGTEVSECELADANCDGEIDQGDLETVIGRLFGSPVDDVCAAAS